MGHKIGAARCFQCISKFLQKVSKKGKSMFESGLKSKGGKMRTPHEK